MGSDQHSFEASAVFPKLAVYTVGHGIVDKIGQGDGPTMRPFLPFAPSLMEQLGTVLSLTRRVVAQESCAASFEILGDQLTFWELCARTVVCYAPDPGLESGDELGYVGVNPFPGTSRYPLCLTEVALREPAYCVYAFIHELTHVSKVAGDFFKGDPHRRHGRAYQAMLACATEPEHRERIADELLQRYRTLKKPQIMELTLRAIATQDATALQQFQEATPKWVSEELWWRPPGCGSCSNP